MTLARGYDLVIFDLDGVVYLGTHAIAGAPEAIRAVVAGGTPVAYATNNASRRAAEVADLLSTLEVPAQPADVVTSAQAAAEMLAERPARWRAGATGWCARAAGRAGGGRTDPGGIGGPPANRGGPGVRAQRRLARAGRGMRRHPGRRPLGRHQHRRHDAFATRAGAGQRKHGGRACDGAWRAYPRHGRGQARTGALPDCCPAPRCGTCARRRRPARHRHRGRRAGWHGQPPGADRCDHARGPARRATASTTDPRRGRVCGTVHTGRGFPHAAMARRTPLQPRPGVLLLTMTILVLTSEGGWQRWRRRGLRRCRGTTGTGLRGVGPSRVDRNPFRRREGRAYRGRVGVRSVYRLVGRGRVGRLSQSPTSKWPDLGTV